MRCELATMEPCSMSSKSCVPLSKWLLASFANHLPNNCRCTDDDYQQRAKAFKGRAPRFF
jgi:hypothetical protein